MKKYVYFRKLSRLDDLNKTKHYLSYIPHSICWDKLVKSRRCALRVAHYFLNSVRFKSVNWPRLSRRLIKFAMLQKGTTNHRGHSAKVVLKQLDNSYRLMGDIESNFAFNRKRYAVIEEFDSCSGGYVTLCLRKNKIFVKRILEISQKKLYKDGCYSYIAHTVFGLLYGFGAVAVANYAINMKGWCPPQDSNRTTKETNNALHTTIRTNNRSR